MIVRAAALFVVGLLTLAGCDDHELNFDNRHAFLERRQSQLRRLDGDLRRYGRIHAMSDGLRHYKSLNGDLISFTQAEADSNASAAARRVWLVDSILARDRIARDDYDRLRQDLIETGFIEVMWTRDFTAFLHDGILDNVNGFILVQPGASPPSLQTELFHAELIVLDEIEPGWYYFATT